MKLFSSKTLISFMMAFAVISATVQASPLVGSQEEILHKQASGEGDHQVHAKPKEDSDNKSFVEKYSRPADFTTNSKAIDWLFDYTSWTTFVFFVIMASALVWFTIAYRRKDGKKAYYTHGLSSRNKLATKSLDIAVFITLDLVLIYASIRDTSGLSWLPGSKSDEAGFIWNYPSEEESLRVMVMPQQWAWNFKYAGTDGKFGTPDDIDTINDMRVPKGRKILLQIKSKDVIHGFFIPNVRMQIDALPGVVTQFWFDAKTTGDYEIACYHHCGTSHYKMKAFLKVQEESDFNSWVSENSKWAVARFDPDDKSTQWGWNWVTNYNLMKP
jgi:cytochrome c oxidase subunit 2